MEKNLDVKSIVMTGFFAAITFLGIQLFRFTLPAVVGTPFIHFGHIFVVMGVLLQGGRRGAISGTMGLVIFDILNGYLHSVPEVLIGTVLKCLIIGFIFAQFRKSANGNRKKLYIGAIICAVTYGLINILIEFVMGTITMMIAGSAFQPAVIGSVTSLPATVINAVFMIAAIIVIYVPISSVYRKTVDPNA